MPLGAWTCSRGASADWSEVISFLMSSPASHRCTLKWRRLVARQAARSEHSGERFDEAAGLSQSARRGLTWRPPLRWRGPGEGGRAACSASAGARRDERLTAGFTLNQSHSRGGEPRASILPPSRQIVAHRKSRMDVPDFAPGRTATG